MQVYRVEHVENRHGPYMCSYEYDEETDEYLTTDALSDLSDRMSAVHNDSYTHPVVTDDVISRDDNWNSDYYCGFERAADSKIWFRGFLEELNSLGYALHVYDINPEFVLQGRRQLAFVKEEAELLEVRSLV